MTRFQLKSTRILRWIVCGAVAVLLPSVAHAVDTGFESFCNRYASDAVAQATKNQQMKCGFEGPRWTTNREDHLNWCMAQDGVYAPPTIEGESRIVALKDCAAKAEEANKPVKKIGKRLPGTSTTSTLPQRQVAKAKDEVDIFKGPGGEFGAYQCGQLNCFMNTDETAPVLDFKDNWYQVQTNKVPGGSGWVAADHVDVTTLP